VVALAFEDCRGVRRRGLEDLVRPTLTGRYRPRHTDSRARRLGGGGAGRL